MAILDIRLIWDQTESVRGALRRRGDDDAVALVDRVLDLDQRRRDLQRIGDDLRAQLNAISKVFGAARGRVAKGTLVTSDLLSDAATALLLADHIGVEVAVLHDRPPSAVMDLLQTALKRLSESVEDAGRQTSDVDAELARRLLEFPNLPLAEVPDGFTSDDNRFVRQWGEPAAFSDFAPLPHWDLGTATRILDFERGVRITGSRFYVLRGRGAHLQRALIQWMLDVHSAEHGYTELYLPFVVSEESLRSSGQLPKFADNLYRDIEEDLWLVPTAEVPLTSMHRGEILESAQLPLRYVAYTPCFRREKMSAGRDVRGIKRGHQFDKVEMYRFVTPEASLNELEALTRDAEDLLQRLGLTYRVVELCAGDLGSAAAKTYDIEVWAPGCGEWLEVSSCSTTEDYQARRANIRYRPEPGARPRYVHTLNGSGLALPRVMIALMETYQQRDGSIAVPEALRPYTRFDSIP